MGQRELFCHREENRMTSIGKRSEKRQIASRIFSDKISFCSKYVEVLLKDDPPDDSIRGEHYVIFPIYRITMIRFRMKYRRKQGAIISRKFNFRR